MIRVGRAAARRRQLQARHVSYALIAEAFVAL